MAINYLNSIDLNRNELQDAQLIRPQIENQPNDAAVNAGATPVTGQLYYNTTSKVLKQYDGTKWVSIAGDITSITQGTYINITDADGPIPTINHDSTTRSDGTSAVSPGYGGTFDVVDSVTSNATGHVTAINLKTVTIPASDNADTTYNLSVGAGAANSSTINLNAGGSGSGTDSITVQGTASGVKVTESGDTITVALQNDIIVDGLTVNNNVLISGDLEVTGDTIMSNETIKSVENNTIAFEGTVVDDTVVKLTAENATGSDKVATLQNKTGTIALLSDITDTQLATASALIDLSVMAANSTASFTHNLASKNLIVQLYDSTSGQIVHADVDHTSVDAISIIFATTGTQMISNSIGDIRVVVIDAKNGLTDKAVSYS